MIWVFGHFWLFCTMVYVTPASGGPTRFVKTIRQSNVFELDSLPRQAQSFQLDTTYKHEDNRTEWIAREEKKKNPTCNASASTSEGEGDKHPAVRTRAEKRQRRKTKETSTTRCVHINTASPASNPDTLTLPPPTKAPRPRGGRKKNKWQRKKKGGKQGREESDINWTAWLARQIMQVQKQRLVGRDRAAEQLFTCGFVQAVVDRLLQQPQFCKTARSPTSALPGARSAPQLATLHASSHGAMSGSRSCLMPWRPFLASVAQGWNNDYSNGRQLALESPRRSFILSTAPKCHTGKWWPNQVR